MRVGGRRPAVWSPGEVLAIDWGTEVVVGRKVHVFCAVLAWSRFRFVRFADNEKATTTFGLLAECFEQLGGVPKTVLASSTLPKASCSGRGSSWSRRRNSSGRRSSSMTTIVTTAPTSPT